MLFEFKTDDVTFTAEDRAYFEEKIYTVKKFLGHEAGDKDSVKAHIKIEKDKHHSGNRFHAKAHLTAPHGGDFVAEVDAENIRGLADLLRDPLERQAAKFHQKNQNL